MSSHEMAANRRGIAFMSLSMASFIVNDSLVKHMSESLPVVQLIFIRGIFSSLLLLLLARTTGVLRITASSRQQVLGPLLKDRRVVARSVLDGFATLVYLTSLYHLPIGNATAINMATPIVITLIAAIALRERISRGRWLAIVAGFTGVLLVVQPAADAFNAWALLCLSGTVIGASRDLLTRAISPKVPLVLITLSTAAFTCAIAGLATFTLTTWHPVSLAHWGMLAIAGFFLSIGYYMLIASLRMGEMSVVSPFRYVGLLFALLVGWVVWGDAPNAIAWAGIALLVGAGLYMVRARAP